MRTLRLARVAVEAEILLLKRRARGVAARAALGAVAGMFLTFGLAVAHVGIWLLLRPRLGPAPSVWAIVGGDVLLGLIFGILASRGVTDPIEMQAREVRDQARAQLRQTLTLGALLGPGLRTLGFLLARRRR